jgi:hypothetical protein
VPYLSSEIPQFNLTGNLRFRYTQQHGDSVQVAVTQNTYLEAGSEVVCFDQVLKFKPAGEYSA